MSWIFLFIVVLVIVTIVRSRSQARPRLGGGYGGRGRIQAREFSPEELASVKRSADEDVTAFGEDLRELDVDLAGHDLDEAARQDYQRALDGYEAAKQSVAAVSRPDEIRHVTEILEDGRYATACVRARVAGQPVPQRRPPCFFNPQHGPSVRDITWAPSGGASREVPVCAADADRIASGAEPQVRQVMVGPRRMPYYQAGPAYQPWTAGYFGGFGAMEMLFVGTMMGGMWGGGFGGYDSGYDQGYDAGANQGDGQGYDDGGQGYDDGGAAGGDAGFDGGGYDGGGYDGGGGSDGGGFDGGGFDGGGF